MKDLKAFTITLGQQIQQVERARTDAKMTLTDRMLRTELDILMTVAKDAMERTMQLSTVNTCRSVAVSQNFSSHQTGQERLEMAPTHVMSFHVMSHRCREA